MRVLFLARDLPLPANNGTRLRTWALLRALAADGHAVSLLAFARSDAAGSAEVAAIKDVCRELQVVPLATESLTGRGNHAARVRALSRVRPYSVQRFSSAEMRRLVRERLDGGAVDAIMCDVFTLTNVPHTEVPVLLNHENVEHTILRRYCSVERNPVKRVYAWLEHVKMRRWERQACLRARVSLPCSAADARVLSALCPTVPSVVTPNVVEMENGAGTAAEDPSMVLFQGGMDWFPNRDAVAFFATAIFPRIRALVPEATFTVAGRNPSPEFVATFAHVPGMTFTGTVPDMRAVISAAAVSVAPLRIGSGTRLKIIEAAALGKPVVATTVGAEGLDFVDGEEIILADEPGRFGEQVAALLRDPARRHAIGRAARRRAEQQYSLSTLRRALARVLARQGLATAAAPRPGEVRSSLAP
jgi:glycosyltransferase involved in cell wall biosynthesis